MSRPVVRAVASSALVVLLASLTACGDAGDAAVRAELGRLEQGLFREASQNFRRNDDPVVLARWAINDSGRNLQGDGQDFTRSVEALGWTSPDGHEGTVDLRLRVTTPGFQARHVSETSYGSRTAERCIRISVGGDSDDSTERIDCADRPALAVPPAPPAPPPLDDAKLERALRSPSFAAAEAATRRAFPGLSVDGGVFAGTWSIVVVRTTPEVECLGGTREPGGRILVREPPQVRPGEGDCDPVSYTNGTN